MSLSSMFTVILTLSIISFFAVFTANAYRFTKGLEQSVQISVLVDYEHESAEEEDRISLAISSLDGVKAVRYSSKKEEFEYYINSFEDDATKEAFAPFADDNPMHDAFYVEVENGSVLESVSAQIRAIEGVEKVNFGGASSVQMISLVRTFRYGGGIVALALSLLAIFMIQNTIKMTIAARAEEIAIMRNVGARNGYIRAPFLIEGLLIGGLGAVLPMGLTFFLYRYLHEVTGGYIVSRMFTLIDPDPFLAYILLLLLAIGLFVGWFGSFLSVTKYLRWKR